MADMENALWGADVVQSNESVINHTFVTAMVKVLYGGRCIGLLTRGRWRGAVQCTDSNPCRGGAGGGAGAGAGRGVGAPHRSVLPRGRTPLSFMEFILTHALPMTACCRRGTSATRLDRRSLGRTSLGSTTQGATLDHARTPTPGTPQAASCQTTAPTSTARPVQTLPPPTLSPTSVFWL